MIVLARGQIDREETSTHSPATRTRG